MNVQVAVDEVAALSAFLQKLQVIEFYGKLELSYEKGRIQIVKTTEHIKPAQLIKAIA
jgi:hypothetical protein